MRRAETYVLRLPAAHPETYLSWVAYWRKVEAKMLEFPALEVAASEQSAPFLHGTIALQLSEVVRATSKQATTALAKGRLSVSPEIRLAGSADTLGEMAFYVQRHADWLREHGQSLGVEPPSLDIRELRTATVNLLRAAARVLSEQGSS